VTFSASAEICCRYWEVLACVNPLWGITPSVPICDLVTHDSLFCCWDVLDNSGGLQCSCDICYNVLLYKRWNTFTIDTLSIIIWPLLFHTLNLIHDVTSSNYFMYSAGWIGHDPLTVVIGESDPYVSIGGRVCFLPHVGAILSNILLSCSLSHRPSLIRR
jgi:hypothetical protein